MKLSQGDSVIVISGKDKGKKGTVMRVLREKNRVVVTGINIVTKHIKKTAQSEGRKVQFEVAIHASNVMVADPKTGKPSRIGIQVDSKTGKKVRIAKNSGTVLGRTKVDPADAKKGAAPTKDAPAKKSPFWKKAGFGSDAAAKDGEVKAEAAPTQSTVTHSRSAGRGS